MLGHPFDDGSATGGGAIARCDRRRRSAATGTPIGRRSARSSSDWPRLEAAVLGPLGCSAPSVRAGAVRIAGAALGGRIGEERVRGRTNQGDVCRHRRARHAAARPPADGRRRPDAGRDVPRGRLADSARRRADASPTRSFAHLQSLGGEVVVDSPVTAHRQAAAGQGRPVRSLAEAAAADRAATRFRARYRRQLERYRYGLGAFKVDWALAAPIPWKADGCRRAGTVHLGGTLSEIAASEHAAWDGTDRRSAVRAPEPADAVRSVARAGRQACGVGLLPRAGRLDRRHARPHRAADRAIRAGIPRLRARAIGA